MPPQRLEDLGEELLGAFFLGVVKNLRGSSHFDDFALSHEDHSVGNFSCKAHFVGDHDHGHALFREFFDDIQNLVNHFGIQCRGRLVKEHHFGFHGKCPSNSDSLLLTARELGGVLIGLLRDLYPGQKLERESFCNLQAISRATAREV